MAKGSFKLFSSDSYSRGFWSDGLYRIETARFVLFDFKGKVLGDNGQGVVCLSLILQPVNKDGKDDGDAKTQYWSIGNDHATIEKGGKSISLTGDFNTVMGSSDLALFHKALAQSGFDMGSVEEEDDCSTLEGQVFEFVRVNRDPNPNKPNDKPGQYVNVKQWVNLGGAKKAAASGKAKAAAADTDNSGSGASGDLEDLLQEFVVDKLSGAVGDNAKGVETLAARVMLQKWLQQEKGLDPKDKSQKTTIDGVTNLFKDGKKLAKVLDAAGYSVAGTAIVLA